MQSILFCCILLQNEQVFMFHFVPDRNGISAENVIC